MFKRRLVLASIIAVFLLCSQVEAAQITSYWDICGEGGWGDANNWDPNDQVPDNDVNNTFAVVIDPCMISSCGDSNWLEVSLTNNYTINQLDCYGQVELGAWTSGWVQLTLDGPNGLTNYGNLWIDEIEINGNVTNRGMLELCEVEIDGDLDNLAGAVIVAEGENDAEGNLENEGELIIIHASDLLCDSNLYNNGQINLYGGECGVDGILDNNSTGVIRGFGILYAEQQLQNQGEITAHGGSLAMRTNYLDQNGTLSNTPVSSLQIDSENDIQNYGTINVNAGGGVAFDPNLVNSGTINLWGGTLAAQNITQAAGATFEGGGTIICRNLLIESGAQIDVGGPTVIGGDVTIVSGGMLVITAGQTFISGQTTNDGTIVLAGGTVIFQGGYSGSGKVSVYVAPADNVALSKAASQSSTASGGVPSRAIDGNIDGDWAQSSVTCTNNEPNSWWQVDLGATYDVSAIEVWNRTGSCEERLDDFYVFVSDTPFASTDLTATLNESDVWSRHVTAVPDPEILFPVGWTGRYVRIQLGDTNYLSLAEVKVFGEVFVP